MCQGVVRFYEQGHSYECDNEKYLSVSKLLALFDEEFDEDAWSWYIAVKLYYIGDFIDKKTNDWYMNDSSIKNHYPLQIWNDVKQGQERKFLIRGDLQKLYLYSFIDRVSDTIRLELAILKSRVLAKWKAKNKRASEGGTAYHEQRERQTVWEKWGIHLEDFKKKEKEKGYKESYIDIYNQVEDGDEPELLIYDHYYKVAGQADRPRFRTKGRSRYVKIHDYKTNEDGITESNKFQQYKYPLGHLDVCKLNHYALQQSAYGFMLERKGFIYEGGILEWRKINFETGEVLESRDIPVPYLKKEVESIFEYYLNSQKQQVKKKSVWDM